MKSTPCASHQAINASPANPLSARTTMRVFGQRCRMPDDPFSSSALPPHRLYSRAASEPPADAVRKKCRAVGSSSSRSNRGRSALVPCTRIIRGIEIEDDLLGRSFVCLRNRSTSSRLMAIRIVADLVIAARLQQLSSSRLSVHLPASGCTVLSPRRKLARQRRQHRIMAQLVVIVEILIAKRNPEHPLADQRHHLVLDQMPGARVMKAGRKPLRRPLLIVRRPRSSRQHRRDRTSIEAWPQLRALQRLQIQTNLRYSLSASGRSSNHSKVVAPQQLSLIRRPDALT